jgi:hypothetical protein
MENENRNLQFEEFKLLDGKFTETNKTFDTQLFSFNVAILTLVFFAINATFSYEISKWFYIPLLFSVLCCGASVWFLLKTYDRTLHTLDIQKELIMKFSEEKSQYCEKLTVISRKQTKYSLRLFVAGFILAIATIFLGIFIIDFQEKTNNTKLYLMTDNMSNQKFQDTIFGPGTKSFTQRIHEVKDIEKSIGTKSFSQTVQPKPTEPKKADGEKK